MRTAILLLVALAGCGGGEAGSASAPSSPTTLFDGPAPADALSLPPALDLPEDAPLVAFVGDSIAAGLHLAEHQAFPALLQRRLAGEHPFRLVNASESGRTTAGGAAAVDWILQSKPDLVVVQVGGNDGLRGIPLDDIEQNLRSMIAAARAGGAAVMLLGVRLPTNYGDYGRAFDALYPKLAAEFELPFAPYYMEGVGAVPEMNLPDGLHPTVEGQERLADNVLPTLRKALARL